MSNAADLPYEEPTNTRETDPALLGPGIDLGPEPTPRPAPPADAVAELLGELAGHERQVFEEALAGQHQQTMTLLDERFGTVEHAQEAYQRGMLHGIGLAFLAILGVVVVGILFLIGLSIVRGLA